jgi:peroxiredoxin Q/BCP
VHTVTTHREGIARLLAAMPPRIGFNFDPGNIRAADPVAAQDKFKAKYDLAFPLASDEQTQMLSAYGVWVEKSMYGRKYMGIERATLLIDRDGTVARVWPKVKVDGHAAEVLAAAQAL